jgi:hypothetical protein
VLVAVERGGPVRAVPVRDDSIASLSPVITRLVDKAAHLMTDQLHSYKRIGKRYASHESVNHARHEYARGNVHNNTAEPFGAILERDLCTTSLLIPFLRLVSCHKFTTKKHNKCLKYIA